MGEPEVIALEAELAMAHCVNSRATLSRLLELERNPQRRQELDYLIRELDRLERVYTRLHARARRD